MSDFAQTGLICTLQRLNDTAADRIEAELTEHAAAHPITLILPCHANDLLQPALKGIIEEVASARFLREVLISMNGWEEKAAALAREIFARLPQPHRILWNDGPRAVAVEGAMAAPVGKGFNVWAACGIVIAEAQSQVIATQDCDVVSFRRENLARLCFAAVHPELHYDFAKMYYSRVTDRLYGRVSRLFLTPLLQAIVRVAGHQPLLDFLQSFRYPLAGECVITRELAAALPVPAGWGLEVGLLCAAFRRAEPRRIAQVDGGRHYDHRHQPLGDERGGLFRMSREIAVTLLAQLCEEGMDLSPPFLDVLLASFERESQEALRRSRHLALINGLPCPQEDEQAVAVFTRALSEARRGLFEDPSIAASSALPAWAGIRKSSPGWEARFLEAIAHGIG
jgi:glucosyl-3-phosphoglycerate synthase